MTEPEILNAVVNICRKYHANEVFLYGSRTKGTSAPGSDFDLAVRGVSDMEALKEEIDHIPTLFSFDVLDMEQCKNELLLKEILEYGRKIYQAV